ncbi:hypothetical protein BH11ARM2_BH11ARM2_23870 [soil metagenome]
MRSKPGVEEVLRLELAEERPVVSKKEVETGLVRVSLNTETREEAVRTVLRETRVEIERVPIGRFVESVPPMREEEGVLIVPVMEEVVVTRLRLVEEVRIRRVEHERDHAETVTLRRETATLEKGEPG